MSWVFIESSLSIWKSPRYSLIISNNLNFERVGIVITEFLHLVENCITGIVATILQLIPVLYQLKPVLKRTSCHFCHFSSSRPLEGEKGREDERPWERGWEEEMFRAFFCFVWCRQLGTLILSSIITTELITRLTETPQKSLNRFHPYTSMHILRSGVAVPLTFPNVLTRRFV